MDHDFLPDDFLVQAIVQLATQGPLLLAYLIGLIVSVVCWKNYPGPALCTFLACGLLLATSIGLTVLQNFLLRAQFDHNLENAGFLLSSMGLIGSVIRAGAFILLLLAVFIGRARLEPRYYPDSHRP